MDTCILTLLVMLAAYVYLCLCACRIAANRRPWDNDPPRKD